MANTVSRKSADLTLEIEKGSTFRHKLTWKSGTAGSETPVDLTGASAHMQIRPTITSATVHYELDSSGNIVLGGTDGTIELVIPHTDTMTFNFKKAVYSLEVTLANGDVRTLVRGNIVAYDEVTRA